MAGNCPKCASRINHDFGIISCHECGAILSIDFDGNVSLSDPDDVPAEPVAVAAEAPASFVEFEASQQIQLEAVEAEPVNRDYSELPEDIVGEGIVEPVAEAEPIAEVEPQIHAESAPEFEENWINQDDSASSGPPPAPTGPVDFADVLEYANTLELDNSPLVYAFRIEGIDHKDIKKKVLDVLSDIRLNIHVKDLIPTIKGGILELHDLSPIRASIIASRLREEAVTFRWRQSVFQSEAPQVSHGT